MGSDNSFPRKFDFSYPNPCEIFSKNTTSIFKFWILSLLSSWLHQTICSWKSKIASDRFITMSGKVITDRPIVTQEEKLNSSRRISLATEHSFMGSSHQWLILIWSQGGSTLGPPPPFWSCGEQHRCKQFARVPWACHIPLPGAQSPVQALTQQFPKPVLSSQSSKETNLQQPAAVPVVSILQTLVSWLQLLYPHILWMRRLEATKVWKPLRRSTEINSQALEYFGQW